MDDIDPEDLPKFEIPNSFLGKLFDFTGTGEGTRGFVLSFVNQDGRPMIFSKTDTQVVEMGLRKALETYLEDAQVFGFDADDQ